MTNNYNIQESKRVPIILNWLGWEGLILVQILNDEEKKSVKQMQGCSNYYVTNSNPNITKQYCKLTK